MTQALVIGRERKGRPAAETVDTVRAKLAEAGWNVEAAVVRKKRALTKRSARAVRDGAHVVVVVGGDGAVLHVVQSLATTPVALGIIPTGTGNLVATNLGIPKDVDGAIACLLEERRRTIDLGQVEIGGDTWWFAVACGIGLDAEVMAATKRPQKLRWGRLAYLANLVRKSGHAREARHKLTIDGADARVRALQVLVANFGRTGLAVTPKLPVVPDDGALDVIVIRGRGRVHGLLAAWEAMRQRRPGRSRGGHAFRTRARTVEVASKPTRPVEIDGTVIGTTPIKIEVKPAALTVLSPASEAP
jgi:diacylglycerol kinase (ATP)